MSSSLEIFSLILPWNEKNNNKQTKTQNLTFHKQFVSWEFNCIWLRHKYLFFMIE